MKKISLYIFAALFLITPTLLGAQNTTGTCTGEIRTDPVAAQACVDKAIAQGEALGYEMSCKVEQLPLAGFIDPTSGKDYILNGVCTVNGSKGHGAYLLAGFTAAPGSNAVIQSINPGWNILKTELAYEGAFAQCGGKAPYGSVVNGVSVYSCTPPAEGATPASLGGSTKTSDGSLSTQAAVQQVLRSIFSINSSLAQNILARYDNYAKEMLSPGTPSPTTLTPATNSQCYQFTKNLTVGDSGTEVFALTYALKHEGFLSQTSSTFDATVMTAVKRFQEAHATEILNILGLTQGTGVVAAKTRAYMNSKCIVPTSVVTSAPPAPTGALACPPLVRSGIKNGVYQYTFTQKDRTSWTVTLNNKAYGSPSDWYYVPANMSFTATDALDLNRQNQGRFNYLQSLPGTAAGNTEYANLFGSFNNAYYDWSNLTKTNPSCPNQDLNTTDVPVPQVSSNRVRYIKVSVADWDTLPLALREITVVGANNTVVRPVSISATDFDRVGYTPASNLIDGNENTVWRATKSASTCATPTDPTDGRGAGTTSGRSCQVFGDLQVITLDLGTTVAIDRVNIMNYGLTDTRVVVIEISTDNNTYREINEVRAQVNAPIADKGMIIGVVKAPGSMGPTQY